MANMGEDRSEIEYFSYSMKESRKQAYEMFS